MHVINVLQEHNIFVVYKCTIYSGSKKSSKKKNQVKNTFLVVYYTIMPLFCIEIIAQKQNNTRLYQLHLIVYMYTLNNKVLKVTLTMLNKDKSLKNVVLLMMISFFGFFFC